MKTFNMKPKTTIALGVVAMSMIMGTNAHAEEVALAPNVNNIQKESRMVPDIKKDVFGSRDDKNFLIKKINASELDVEKIRFAIESKNFTEFEALLLAGGVKEKITETQFANLNEAYLKAREGDISGAQKLMKDNNLLPMLNRFVMGQHLSLTDEQKEALKQVKKDEITQTLKEVGISQKAISKIEKEFDVEQKPERKSLVGMFKKFFKFGNR